MVGLVSRLPGWLDPGYFMLPLGLLSFLSASQPRRIVGVAVFIPAVSVFLPLPLTR